MPEPELRHATPEDAGAIGALEPVIFGATAWSSTMVRDELTAPHRAYFVLESAGEIIGYAGLLCVGIEADVQTIGLTESARGSGQGARLLQTLIDTAKQRGAEHMFLEVREDNARAIRLYEQHGFQPIARREGYYQPENIAAIIMHVALTPETGEEAE